jgi:putative endonuclease
MNTQGNHKHFGQAGENVAVEYLVKKGYTICHTNFRTRRGELDIVAVDPRNVLTFVEVKSSRTSHAGSPESWVGPRKIRQIQKIAQEYCFLQKVECRDMQFDVIGIDFQHTSPEIQHIPNAFLPQTQGYF